MSQNKTRVPGLEPEGSNFYGGQQQQSAGNFYSRRSGAASHGTVVPGMTTPNRAENEESSRSMKAEPQVKGHPLQLGKPIVGFLYSISRTPAGEFWPLQVGPNKIGTDPSSDILLPEGTVSQDHAVLVIRKLKSSGNVIASITDAQSTNGTMLNGESLGFNPVECHNGDKIIIGENYELILFLIDTTELGLSVSENFIPLETDAEDENDMPDPLNGLNGNTNPFGESVYGGSPVPPPFGGGFSSGGTVGLDGSNDMGNKGGTRSI